MFARLFAPTVEASAHCDLPCGVYDPAQARIEAESVKAIIGKLADNDDPDFRTRAVISKEQRSELVKHHLWVLWTDYFKPPHFEKYPQLHTLFNEATKLAGGGGGPQAVFDAAVADQLLRESGRQLWGGRPTPCLLGCLPPQRLPCAVGQWTPELVGGQGVVAGKPSE